MKPIYTLRIIYITLWVSISCSFLNAQTLQVIPDDIYFNNNLGHSTDVLTIRDDDGNSFELPEYSVYLGNRNNPFAYVMGQQSRTIEVVFSDSSPYEYDGMAHLIVNLSVTDGNGIGTVCNVFIPNYYLSGSPCVLNFTSSLPDVGKHEFTWKWDIYAIPVNEPGYCAGWNTTETTHTYYTVLAEPQAPMEEPWTSVLDYACDWAEGFQEEEPCVYWITNKAYTDLGKVYWANDTHTYDDELFDLSDFLNEGWADCRDMSAVVQIFSNAIGVQNVYVRKIQGPFEYNEIIPVGVDSTVTGSWSFHQVGYFNNVYDACLMLTIPNNHVPVNESINNEYKTSLRKDGAWTVQDTFRYIEVE